MENDVKKIIKKIMNIFVLYGIRSLSMDTIAQHIPISKKELNKIAKNKEELIQLIFLYRFEKSNEIFAEIQSDSNVKNAIDELLHITLLMYKVCDEFNPQLDFEFNKYYPHLFLQYEEKKQGHIKHAIIENIERGKREKIFKHDIDSVLTAEEYFQSILNLHNSINPKDLERMHFELFVKHIENHINFISNEEGLLYFESKKHLLQTIITHDI